MFLLLHSALKTRLAQFCIAKIFKYEFYLEFVLLSVKNHCHILKWKTDTISEIRLILIRSPSANSTQDTSSLTSNSGRHSGSTYFSLALDLESLSRIVKFLVYPKSRRICPLTPNSKESNFRSYLEARHSVQILSNSSHAYIRLLPCTSFVN